MKIFSPDLVGQAQAQQTTSDPASPVEFHSHANTGVLSKLAADGDELMFNGKPVVGLEHITAYLDGAITLPSSAATIAYRDFVLPQNCEGSRAFCKTKPSKAVSIPIVVGGTQLCTVTVSTAGECSFVGPTQDKPVTVGSDIEFVFDDLANTGGGDLAIVLRLVAA